MDGRDALLCQTRAALRCDVEYFPESKREGERGERERERERERKREREEEREREREKYTKRESWKRNGTQKCAI